MSHEPMRLTDTNNILRTWVPSIPPPMPPSYLRWAGESIHISYVPSSLVWYCRFDLSNRLDVKVTSTALRPMTRSVSAWRLLTWSLQPGNLVLTVWVSNSKTFIADGTETSLVMYVSTAFTTSMFTGECKCSCGKSKSKVKIPNWSGHRHAWAFPSPFLQLPSLMACLLPLFEF